MSFLVEAIASIAPYIYAACGLLALFQLYRTWQVRAERKQAVFSLEREKAVGDLYNIFLSALLMLIVMGVTYFAGNTLRSAIAAVEPSVTPTATPRALGASAEAIRALIPTPTFTPEAEAPTPTPGPTRSSEPPTPAPVVQTPEPTPEPPTPEPPPPVVAPALCPDGRSVILSPGNGAVVSGVVSIVGTAQHDQFSYYKLEYAPAGAQSYSWFDGGESQVSGGLLGNLNSSALPNGAYTIQLVVVDTTGNYPEPCRVTVTVQN